MGWDTDLQDASFRGVQFECTSTKDTSSKTLAIKQAPYSDEAEIEDMGNEPRRISIQAVYTGSDYLTWVNALESALLATGSGELIHPVFGVQQVNVVNHQVDHDAENPDFCSISIEFIKAKAEKRELFVPVAVPEKIATTTIIDAPASALESALEKLKIADSDKLFSTVNTIRNGIDQARTYLGVAKQAIEDVLSPADWIVGLVDDVTKLVTFDTNISALSKWRDVVHRVERFENLFQDDDDSPELQRVWRSTLAASQVAIAQQVVATTRSEMANNQEISFTPVDLALVRKKTREVLQQAIREERAINTFESITQIQVYKDVAAQIQDQIQELIETRPPITKTQIPVPCTLHWLAHYLYGDMSRADEIRRLNPDLVNPAALQVGMELTIYAR
ncbi:DNA circularization N-terminal domain-containing protein [Acinetobacter pittii]|uniref:DNA circularization protein n=1 Tax=Acinetobacter calcoaceticus/baumannii complex TaxID=909768 RepID=UPI000461D3AC|nr:MULTISPECIES: DNA circularization N-terminal domain-containing protein [Acinetobacter calcoaceticus/baumannii complex]KCX14508.1 DNA circulation family protein [Acinetobacter sp. 1264765]KRI16817.1 multidrug DMT transporter [Acinetobacter pittii]MDP7900661.1 DNA circularization N-terminal domain-containing protein [Acinetobacter pittii]